MSKVLYIKTNIKEQSRTYQISDAFIEEYKKSHPEDEIITLDLYKENIDFLRPEDLGAVFGPKTEESKNHKVLKYAYQFAQADKYIFADPMWNLGVPAMLKAYIDYVSVTGITFKYTETGPVGLLKGKKAIHITSAGGNYENAPVEMSHRYLQTILSFFGIEDIEFLAAYNLDVQGIDTQAILDESIEKAKKLAVEF